MSDEQQPPTGALSEVLKHWTASCLQDSEEPTPEELQKDSRTFFRYLSGSTQILTSSNIKLETRSSHEEALAKLVQDLGPAFSAEHHQSRLKALHVLVGAIAGCKDTKVSNAITQLLGKFLLSHCGPIDDDDYGEDYDSMIRNAAILGLTAITGIPSSGNSDGELLEAFRMRLEFSWQGIESRCASALDDAMQESQYSYGFEDRNMNRDIREGLSTLPRSKRSLCFGLVGSAIKGVAAITNNMEKKLDESLLPSLQSQLVEFARLAANCLHGESDPRCLLELLTILHQMQVSFEPYFLSSANHDLVFPSEDIFDAVAPYYPVQFTPPPHNVHGISREGLHTALLAVLSYTRVDDNARAHSRHTMLNLSTGLFLEQLLPVEGDENPGPVDKLEAVDCLSRLLFPADGTRLCDKLDIPTLRNLWTAIKATHDESSLGISKSGVEGENNKLLADQCRTLVSKLTFQLEMVPNKALWDTFVSEPLRKQITKLKLSPSHSKLSIAYIACLAASGGPRTLRFCLEIGLKTLLEYLSENMDDTEDAAAAAHGVGAFLSSCQVAMERAKKEGVVLNPHPLESYATNACQVLLDAFSSDTLSLPIKVGATRALEFLVLSVDEEFLGEKQMTRICSFVKRMLTILQESGDEIAELQNACCLTLGTIVGKSLEGVTGESLPKSLLSSQVIHELVKTEIYPCLLQISSLESQAPVRYDRKAISVASACSEGVAKDIVASLLQSLIDHLGSTTSNDKSCKISAESLSYILQHGGDVSVKAYHESELSVTVLDALSKSSSINGAMRASVAKLALPNTTEENKNVQAKIHSIVMLLTPAYKKGLPEKTLVKLAKEVSDIVPPLSPEDNINLYVKLPILGAAMTSLNSFPESNVMGTDGVPSLQHDCTSMLPGLTEYVLSNEYDSNTRSAAASCIYAIVSLVGNLGLKDCPVLPLVKDIINPSLLSATTINTLTNCLNMMALVGSAAARRGGSSGNTAGEISKALVELAWSGRSALPYSSNDETGVLDLASFGDKEVSSTLEFVAASAYGQMLAIDTKPLMKQRLTYTCIKYINTAYENERSQAQAGQAITAPEVGLLTVVCHLICAVDVSTIDKMTMHKIASILVEGLSSSKVFDTNGAAHSSKSTTSAGNLVLVAILKLVSVSPRSVPANGFLLTMVTGLLKAYAVSDPSTGVSSKLLALQGLEAMVHLEGAKKQIAAIQPAVVAVLAAAINHPSGLLRQAAVDVRNAWYLVD